MPQRVQYEDNCLQHVGEVAGDEMTTPACDQGWKVVYNLVVAVFGHSSTLKDYALCERYAPLQIREGGHKTQSAPEYFGPIAQPG